ncbi:MAG: DUF1874 domain-containing protein [Thermofilum sp.]|uniref:STIV orfB116 family protein n=1 Tax=Thermofilum sp. TaxID=1961369 RepID=UPI0025858CB1|nr:DUF1874 domain-containing protein [Thermofilum sp.]MCI4409130.1 DUF1874 domain-containing protein [Thermofilum sp.]
MGTVYLSDAFSPNMLVKFPVKIIFDKLNKEEFCEKLHIYSQTGDLKVAIGRESSARIINVLCGSQFQKNKSKIILTDNSRMLIILTRFKIDESKPLSDEKVREMYKKGEIELYEAFL